MLKQNPSIMFSQMEDIEKYKQLITDELRSQEVKLEKMRSKAYAILDKFSDEQQSNIKGSLSRSEERVHELKDILAKLNS